MCLLDGVLARVQAPRWAVHQRLIFASSFSGSVASSHAPPGHENKHRKSSFAMAILLRQWRMRAQWKAHDPLRQSAWLDADRAANNAANMAASLAPLNLR